MSQEAQMGLAAVIIVAFVVLWLLTRKTDFAKLKAGQEKELQILSDRLEVRRLYTAKVKHLIELLEKGSRELRQKIDSPNTNAELRDVAVEILQLDARLSELDPNHKPSEMVAIAFKLADRPSWGKVERRH